METPSTDATNTGTTVATLADLAQAKRLPTFAVVLEGDGLRPKIPAGSVLTVCTEREPLPGDVVLATVNGETRAMLLNADGDLLDMRRGYVGFDGGRGYELVGTVIDTLYPEETPPL